MALRYCVGIDLGTSNSALAYADLEARDPGESVSVFEVPQLVGPADVAPRPLLPSHLYLPGRHELAELPPIEAELPAREGSAGEVLPVGLRAAATEVGTLELTLLARDPAHAGTAWKLEFSLRGEGEPGSAASG